MFKWTVQTTALGKTYYAVGATPGEAEQKLRVQIAKAYKTSVEANERQRIRLLEVSDWLGST